MRVPQNPNSPTDGQRKELIMSDINKSILIGHLGADPEYRKTTNGKSVCNFSVGCNSSWTDKATGQRVEKVEWIRCTAWGPQADAVGTYMSKGKQVYVEGRMETESYEGTVKYANGQFVVDGNGNQIKVMKYATKVIAHTVKFLSKREGNTAYQAQPAAAPAAAPAVPASPAAVGQTFTQPAAPQVQAPAAPTVDFTAPQGV